jgi:hypothetical protein
MKRVLKYGLPLAIVLIMGFLILEPSIRVGEVPKVEFLLERGNQGDNNGNFNQPIGIAVEHKGDGKFIVICFSLRG